MSSVESKILERLQALYKADAGLPQPRADGSSPVGELIKHRFWVDSPTRRRQLQDFFLEFPEIYRWLPDHEDRKTVSRFIEVVGDVRSGAFSTEYLANMAYQYVGVILQHTRDPTVGVRLIRILSPCKANDILP